MRPNPPSQQHLSAGPEEPRRKPPSRRERGAVSVGLAAPLANARASGLHTVVLAAQTALAVHSVAALDDLDVARGPVDLAKRRSPVSRVAWSQPRPGKARTPCQNHSDAKIHPHRRDPHHPHHARHLDAKADGAFTLAPRTGEPDHRLGWARCAEPGPRDSLRTDRRRHHRLGRAGRFLSRRLWIAYKTSRTQTQRYKRHPTPAAELLRLALFAQLRSSPDGIAPRARAGGWVGLRLCVGTPAGCSAEAAATGEWWSS